MIPMTSLNRRNMMTVSYLISVMSLHKISMMAVKCMGLDFRKGS
jgi:hypothetical protein